MRRSENRVEVSLTGGLGNQLFGLAIGLEQSKRLQLPLILDDSAFNSGNPRSIEIGNLYLASLNCLVSNLFSSNSTFSRKLPTFKETQFSYMDSVNSLNSGHRLIGYFQSHKYFRNVIPELVSAVQTHKLTEQQELYISSLDLVNSTVVHLRRGDYLDPQTNSFHGTVDGKYVLSAIDILERIQGKREVVLFSDSPELASDELSSKGIAHTTFRPTVHFGALDTLIAMTRGQSFIMSNSSFSWWAAYLMYLESDESSLVVAPRPWFRSGESASDLLIHSWITLGSDSELT